MVSEAMTRDLSGAESALMTDRKSARMQSIEVITRGERRRSWSVEQKREIVAESLEQGMSPIAVARRHGIGSGLLYTWRRQLRDGQFARVAVSGGPQQRESAVTSARAEAKSQETPSRRRVTAKLQGAQPQG